MRDAIAKRAAAAAFSLVAMGLVGMSFSATAAGATFVVTRTGDADGPCGATCTLRQAIQAANATSEMDTIHFNIPACGTKTIPIASTLVITKPVLIDASSQPTCGTTAPGDHTSLIELRGPGINKFQENPNYPLIDGFFLQAGSDNSSIRGFAINSFSGPGIHVESDNNFIFNNKSGTDPTGNLAKPNGVGIFVNYPGTHNDIAGNLLSGNKTEGLSLGADSTAVRQNRIGVAADGVTPLPNGGQGILIAAKSNDNKIGLAAPLGNTIAFNDANGIDIVESNTGNTVFGNKIFSNTGSGILMEGSRANGGQVAPTITSLSRFTTSDVTTSPPTITFWTKISGTLANASAGGFSVDLYVNDAACDNPSTVEGQAFLATASVGTDGTFFLATSLDLKSSITAIGRSLDGNTSAFSACKTSPHN